MRIGFIGLGIMGEPMCENIIKKHDDKVYGYDHHEENIAKIVAAGVYPVQVSVKLQKTVISL